MKDPYRIAQAVGQEVKYWVTGTLFSLNPMEAQAFPSEASAAELLPNLPRECQVVELDVMATPGRGIDQAYKILQRGLEQAHDALDQLQVEHRMLQRKHSELELRHAEACDQRDEAVLLKDFEQAENKRLRSELAEKTSDLKVCSDTIDQQATIEALLREDNERLTRELTAALKKETPYTRYPEQLAGNALG